MLEALDKRLDLGRTGFLSVFALGHHQLSLPQSAPCAYIVQVRVRVDPSFPAAPLQEHAAFAYIRTVRIYTSRSGRWRQAIASAKESRECRIPEGAPISMIIHLGNVHELVRYPVKSMAGIATDSAFLGWHGFQGDRRFAFRRLNDNSGFPWLTASRLPELLLYQPLGLDENAEEPLPTHVRTPEGAPLPLGSAELQNSIAEKFGSAVELMKLKHGIFDEASVSVINLATISAIGREAGQNLDTRRFRANIVIATDATEPFLEDGWIGGRLVFGGNEVGPMLSITMRDPRCMMINLDPDTAKQDPRVMKAVVRLNKNDAGAYGTVARVGQISVGQSVSLIIETQA